MGSDTMFQILRLTTLFITFLKIVDLEFEIESELPVFNSNMIIIIVIMLFFLLNTIK